LVQIGAADGQCAAIGTKVERGDGGIVFVELTKAFLVETVPNVDYAIGTASGERLVDIVETQGIHRVDLLYVLLPVPVALEGEFAPLHFGIMIQVLHGHPALDGGHHVALLVGEQADAAGLIL